MNFESQNFLFFSKMKSWTESGIWIFALDAFSCLHWSKHLSMFAG